MKFAHGKTCKYAARLWFTHAGVSLQWQNESMCQRSKKNYRFVLRVIAFFESWIIWIHSWLETRYVRVSCLECQVTFERYCMPWLSLPITPMAPVCGRPLCGYPNKTPWCHVGGMIGEERPVMVELPHSGLLIRSRSTLYQPRDS